MDGSDTSTGQLFSAANLRRMHERDARDAPPPPVPPRQPAPPTPATVGPPPPFLAEEHRAHLRTSGLSDETIAACRFETAIGDAESELRVAKLLGWKRKPPEKVPLGRGILIPYSSPDSPPTCWAFRPDTPRPMKNKQTGKEREKPAKYLRTTFGKGEGSPPYLPANGHAALADPNALLVICEGEKKGAALAQLGYRVVAIAGVYNAHTKDGARWLLREDIAVHARSANAVIAFDNDAHENPDVRRAARRLAGMLRDAGSSSVRFATPPRNGPKGFDDLLAASGEQAVRAAIEAAEPIEPESTEKEPLAWNERLVLTKHGTIQATTGNASIILDAHPTLAGLFAYNERANAVVYSRTTPWGGMAGPMPETDLVRLAAFVGELEDVRASFSTPALAEAVAYVARRSSFDPVRVYLDGLSWDGRPRLDRWLLDYAGAVVGEYEPEGSRRYIEAVGARWLISAVARVYKPGTKCDHVLVLEGEQGKMKSSLLAALVPHADWFTDHLPDLRDKDAKLALHGPLVVEWAELSSLKKSDVETVKAFITTTHDRLRPPYGRQTANFPRRCVFAGTVNPDGAGYLNDPTGARRFWPVAVGTCDPDGFAKVRDQVWAEAVERFRLGERWWPEAGDPISVRLSVEHERGRTVDQWEPSLEELLRGVRTIEMREVLERLLGEERARLATRNDQMRVARVMKQLGFERRRLGKERIWAYVRATGGSS
ncbi:MAG: VapE domain-containing protein [Deltaproteobacteria bacterium]